MRISSTDYFDGGLNPQDLALMLKPLVADNLLDAIDVSSGGLLPIQPTDTHPGYQLPDAAVIKQHLHVPVIAVGKIYTRSFADWIIGDGLADAVALGAPPVGRPRFRAENDWQGLHSIECAVCPSVLPFLNRVHSHDHRHKFVIIQIFALIVQKKST